MTEIIFPRNGSELQSHLKHILERHIGKYRAITAKELTGITGVPDRAIRLAIRELIARNVPIASSVTPPYGYYLISNHTEAREYAESIKGRLIEDAMRRRDFNRAASFHLQPAQQGRLIL